MTANSDEPAAEPEILSLSIQENAVDSLTTAIENYFDDKKPTAWKHAIQSAAQAVELFLKVALEAHDPQLIFKNMQSGFTVGYDMALERLAGIGIEITDDEQNDIRVIRQLRNKLEHADAVATRAEVEEALARSMRFLDAFLPALDIDIADLIPDKHRFLEFKQSIQPASEWMKQAEGIASASVPWRDVQKGARYEVVLCPECFGEAVAVGDGIEVPKCVHCLTEFSEWETCPSCGTPILEGVAEGELEICEACWDHRWNKDD